MLPTIPALVFATVAILSVVTFVIYGVDKRAARKQQRRVPERVLHLLAASGGWPGAYLGQRAFRHKSRKQPFQTIFWATLIPPLATVALTVFAAMR